MVLWITVTILIEYSATLPGLFRYDLARVRASSAILEGLFLASLLCEAVFVCKGFRGVKSALAQAHCSNRRVTRNIMSGGRQQSDG